MIWRESLSGEIWWYSWPITISENRVQAACCVCLISWIVRYDLCGRAPCWSLLIFLGTLVELVGRGLRKVEASLFIFRESNAQKGHYVWAHNGSDSVLFFFGNSLIMVFLRFYVDSGRLYMYVCGNAVNFFVWVFVIGVWVASPFVDG